MRKTLTILLCLSFLKTAAQRDVVSLTGSLVKNARTDREKVTVIFRWITDNIAYTTFTKSQKKNKNYSEEPEEEGPLKPLNLRVAETVLKRGTAFCDGFARLFTAMCDQAGIRSEIICGYANGGIGRGNIKFGVNHYWNAVFLEDKWHLLDATWASGYLNMRDGEFVREYNARYFLATPEYFIRDHYPDDPRWTLLPDEKMPDEFRNSPFRQRAFNKYQFISFYPGKGVIDASVGDTIVLQLEPGKTDAGTISPYLNIDSSFFSHSPAWVFLKPDKGQENPLPFSRMQYTYTVADAGIKWLYLLYNDDVVMRYRVNVRSKQLN